MRRKGYMFWTEMKLEFPCLRQPSEAILPRRLSCFTLFLNCLMLNGKPENDVQFAFWIRSSHQSCLQELGSSGWSVNIRKIRFLQDSTCNSVRNVTCKWNVKKINIVQFQSIVIIWKILWCFFNLYWKIWCKWVGFLKCPAYVLLLAFIVSLG